MTAKEKPILFSTPMVQAILRGEKRQTRRVVKSSAKKIRWTPIGYCDEHDNPIKQKYEVGDILWVRETFQYTDESINDTPGYVYRASDPDWGEMKGFSWRPSIFMPRAAARIFLEVVNVRLEQLHDITEEDAIAEGIEYRIFEENDDRFRGYRLYGLKGDQFDESPVVSFRSLWESINGKESWNDNPFVFVYEFKKNINNV